MNKSPSDIFLTTIEKMSKWAADRSVWPLSFGLSCCAIEMMHAAASRIDLDRYGCIFRASPKQADLMIIAGTATVRMESQIKTLYNQMLSPKYVIAMGSCASSGGLYVDSPLVIQGVQNIIPVSAYVNGCPPLPEDLAECIINLRKKTS